jgi:hypothetical protein
MQSKLKSVDCVIEVHDARVSLNLYGDAICFSFNRYYPDRSCPDTVLRKKPELQASNIGSKASHIGFE